MHWQRKWSPEQGEQLPKSGSQAAPWAAAYSSRAKARSCQAGYAGVCNWPQPLRPGMNPTLAIPNGPLARVRTHDRPHWQNWQLFWRGPRVGGRTAPGGHKNRSVFSGLKGRENGRFGMCTLRAGFGGASTHARTHRSSAAKKEQKWAPHKDLIKIKIQSEF